MCNYLMISGFALMVIHLVHFYSNGVIKAEPVLLATFVVYLVMAHYSSQFICTCTKYTISYQENSFLECIFTCLLL